MVAATTTVLPAVPTRPASRFRMAVVDTITIAWRNVKGMQRVPEVVVFSTICRPVVFPTAWRRAWNSGLPFAETVWRRADPST